MAGIYFSAACKSSGKTIVSVGIAAAARARSIVVQPFKKGPDYIDPMWLGAAAGRPCRNLDFHTMSPLEIRSEFQGHDPRGPSLRLVEGTKGLHDGVSIDGRDSNAALARLLDIPVVLVIDTRGITRGIAPLLLGYRDFDPSLALAGVILNRTGGSRHETKLVRAVEEFTDLPVLGVLGTCPALSLADGHLGLVPPPMIDDDGEAAKTGAEPARRASCEPWLQGLASAVAAGVDLTRILALSDAAAGAVSGATSGAASGTKRNRKEKPRDFPAGVDRKQGMWASPGSVSSPSASSPSVSSPPTPSPPTPRAPTIRIAIAWDAAFRFYYPGDLESLARQGAEIVFFDTLRDAKPPAADGIFIGGGFPERALPDLKANIALRRELRERIEKGLPVYAECGGLMYLARGIRGEGRDFEMVGAIPGDIRMHSRPQGRGYALLSPTGAAPWLPAGKEPLPAHEFHHSSIENLPSEGWSHAYRVRRGYGIDGERDGIVIGNLLAGYCHLREVQGCRWTGRFVDFLRRRKIAGARSPEKEVFRSPRPVMAGACGNSKESRA